MSPQYSDELLGGAWWWDDDEDRPGERGEDQGDGSTGTRGRPSPIAAEP